MVPYYMGVDPSTVSTGYAILNENGELVRYGTINPPEAMKHHEKLQYQYEILDTLLVTYGIVSMVCEEQFNGPSVDTLKKIARTSAAVMMIAAKHKANLEMMYPVSWRKMFHNKGNATKKDTLKLVNEIHSLSLKGKDNDIADAIGMAHACLQKWVSQQE